MVKLTDICSCIRKLHPDLQSRVSPETLHKYKEALDPFLMYLQNRFDVALEDPEDVDCLLQEFRTEFELTRSKHTLLVAAVEFFIPHLKGKLVLSREALKGRTNAEHINHTVPLPSECAHLITAWHASEGRFRLGAAILIQHCTGLRPSELLGIQKDHVFVPNVLLGSAKVSIRLGAVVSTKVKREQNVLISFDENPFECKLLEWLVASTSEGDRIFKFGYSSYNNSFKQAEQHFGLQAGWTAHSGRAGFATDLIVRGVPHSTVQSRGRWLSESSFRCYIDVVGSLGTQARVASKGLWPEAVWCQQHIDQYFAPVLIYEKKKAYFSRPNVAPRFAEEGESVFASSSSRRAHILGKTTVARSRTGQALDANKQHQDSCTSRGPSSSSDSGKGISKGKGRGRLSSKTSKGSIFD